MRRARRPRHTRRLWPPLLGGAVLATACLLPAAAQAADLDDWTGANRWIGLSAGRQVMDYRERDTQGLTHDGTLDTETGRLATQRVAARWQFDSGWVVDLSGQRASGSSRYDGYLQSGGALTAYQATSHQPPASTGNKPGAPLRAMRWAPPKRLGCRAAGNCWRWPRSAPTAGSAS